MFVLIFGIPLGGYSRSVSNPQDTALRDALYKDLQDYLDDRAKIEHISTLSLTVSFRTGPSFNLAVGMTQYGGGKPVTPSNLFQIGSNTKAFTSAIVLRLEEAGVLSIGDTVGRWLPQYPAWSKITIRQLLNMTSRIPTYDQTPRQIADYDNDPYVKSTPSELVAYIYPDLRTSGPDWGYSNTSYMLVQMIIDKALASKDRRSPASESKDYYTIELKKLIDELGLTDTFYEPYFYPASVRQRLVSGYYVNTEPPVLTKLLGKDTSGFSLGWTQSAGGMISTPEDLTKWVRLLLEGHVLKPKQWSELTSLITIPDGQPIAKTTVENAHGFALGLFQVTDPKLGLFWGYQGSTIGYRAAYSYFPASRVIICVFTNSQVSGAESEVNSVLFHTLYDTLKAHGKM
jgi:D-alanyl-D-alanine carboxypeptidase